MHAPSLHGIAVTRLSSASHEFSLFGRRTLIFAALLWRGVKVFYGVGAVALAAAGMLAYVTLGADTTASLIGGDAAGLPAIGAAGLPAYSSQVIYIVGSQRQAENLLAYGAGLPSGDPSRLLPEARVTVLVVNSPEDSLRIATSRTAEAYLNDSGMPISIIDLR